VEIAKVVPYRKLKTVFSTFIKLLHNFIILRGKIGFIDSIEKWIENEKSTMLVFESHPTNWYKTFRNESELINIDGRFRGRGDFRFFNHIRWCLHKEIKIYYMSGVHIFGENAIVMSSSGRIFKELTYPKSGRVWRYGEFFGKVFLPVVSFKAGWYTSLNSPTSYNFFHWVMECLPRLAVLEEYVKLFDGFIVPAQMQPFHHESLKAIGIDAHCLIAASSRSHLKLEHFFATDYSARDNPPAWLHLWYKKKFIQPFNVKVKPGRRIYVSRADAVYRKALNGEEIERMVSAFGFEIITLSQMSFLEQAAVFYSSDVIVAEHGSGLANLVFCREETKVIEIFSPFRMYPCFYAIAESVGLQYDFFIAELDQISPLIANRMGSDAIDNVAKDWINSANYRVAVTELKKKIVDII
jgi:hypothetical protein